MPLHHAVLALLSHSPSYGYELKARFEDAVGPQWGEVNIGHLYQVLDRLTRDRFVTKRSVAQTDRPDKTVYRITQSGRRELERWLTEPYASQTGYRDDVFLKLFAAAEIGAESLRQVLESQRAAWLGELKGLRELAAEHRGEPLVELLIAAAAFHTEANLKVIEEAEASKDRLIEAAEQTQAAGPPERKRTSRPA